MQDILTTIATAVEIAAATLFIGGFLAHVAAATSQPKAAAVTPDHAAELPETDLSELPELFAMADAIALRSASSFGDQHHVETVAPVTALLPTETATVADLAPALPEQTTGDLRALSPYELRSLCQQSGIKWRNA